MDTPRSWQNPLLTVSLAAGLGLLVYIEYRYRRPKSSANSFRLRGSRIGLFIGLISSAVFGAILYQLFRMPGTPTAPRLFCFGFFAASLTYTLCMLFYRLDYNQEFFSYCSLARVGRPVILPWSSVQKATYYGERFTVVTVDQEIVKIPSCFGGFRHFVDFARTRITVLDK